MLVHLINLLLFLNILAIKNGVFIVNTSNLLLNLILISENVYILALASILNSFLNNVSNLVFLKSYAIKGLLFLLFK